jgi:hypothetical protein
MLMLPYRFSRGAAAGEVKLADEATDALKIGPDIF